MPRAPSTLRSKHRPSQVPMPARKHGMLSDQRCPVRSATGRHVIPKERINIEELVQREFKYHKIWDSALEVMLKEPARAERVSARLHATGKTLDTESAQDVVPFNGDPSAYLRYLDDLLAKDPPYSFEDQILRGHYAHSALSVFEDYVKGRGLVSSPAASDEIDSRVTELLSKHHQSLRGTGSSSNPGRHRDMQPRFLGDAHSETPTSSSSVSSLPLSSSCTSSSSSLPSSSPSHCSNSLSSSRSQVVPITPKIADEWLSKPTQSGLNRYYFTYKATREPGNPEPTTWKLTGISLHEGEVCYSLKMAFPEGCCNIPYDAEALKDLLVDSEIEREIPRKGTTGKVTS
ncbi:hypothetical protein BC834DRAFT_1036078 [Gloeopeniophorella convolvens]|nr:hypothetical protein BC834DRAFT_1036078 [Gloeopeniophorella convolvens]